MTASTIFMIAIGPLIVWRMYSRIRRLIGRQQSRAWRHWAAAIFFPLLIVLLALGAMASAFALASLLAGLAIGIGLAVWGLRLTRFERTDLGYFYTPSAHIGIALSAILVARLVYRLTQMATLTGLEARLAAQDFGRSPFTLIIIGTLAAYYAWYAIGLLQWRAQHR
jgi:cytochrome b561